MRRAWCWCLASASVFLVGGAEAATYVQRKVFHEIHSDGSVLEGEEVAVRLESNEDRRWLHYDVLVDENVELDTLSGTAIKPDGTTVNLDRREISDLAYKAGSFHASTRIKRIEFREVLPVGTVVRYQGVVKRAPYHPSGGITIYDADPVENLHVELRGPANLTWKIEGRTAGLDVREEAGKLVVTAANLPRRDSLRWAPRGGARFPVVRYRWGEDSGWRDVGLWYDALVSQLSRRDEAVVADAIAMTARLESGWDKLNRLLAFAQREIRYVDVEIGIGGYRPSSPVETHERKWGDCKDKALLLIDMLGAAGIPAFPALIQSSLDGRIDPEFPSMVGFNHLIVAVEQQPWMEGRDLALADGYLFVDPTQRRGLAEWLGPQTQDKHALVVRGTGSELVRTPTRHQQENRRLGADLQISPEGSATGSVTYSISGVLASVLLTQMESEDPARTEEDVRALFARLFPGAQLTEVAWEPIEGALPGILLRGHVFLERLIEGAHERRSFRVPAVLRTPESRVLTDRETPVVLQPIDAVQTWRLRLPAGWCPARAGDTFVDNPIGHFSQSVSQRGDLVEVRRELTVRRRWVESGEFAALRELSLAEHRSGKRRIRLSCREARSDSE